MEHEGQEILSTRLHLGMGGGKLYEGEESRPDNQGPYRVLQ